MMTLTDDDSIRDLGCGQGYKPAGMAFLPGVKLADELEARGHMPSDFARTVGLDPQTIPDFTGGKPPRRSASRGLWNAVWALMRRFGCDGQLGT